MYRDKRRNYLMKRREFVTNAGLFAGAFALGSVTSQQAQAQPANTGANPTPYTIKPLPFDPKSIRGLSEKLLVSHHDNNYAGAVRRLNAIEMQLANLDFATAPNFLVNGLKREELIAANSMILHEHYFDAIGGGGDPIGPLAEAIRRDFGSLERWRAEFTAMGKAQGGGSGWTILTYSPRDRRLINTWAADHTNNLADGRPVLVLDMYEHSYHIDYGSNAAGYVDAFMQVIRWDTIGAQYDRVVQQP